MKLLICLVFMLISAKECDKNKAQMTSDTSSQVTTEMTEARLQEETMKINYKAHTRGFFLQIWIEGDSMSVTNDYNLKDIRKYQIPKEEKDALMALISETDEKSLPGLEPPSRAFRYDGAPMAHLEISKGEDTYKTENFDHGTPPEAIKSVVEKILSIKTLFEKQ
ncbi:hypothetical protein [Psychroserpens luteolus]|uniref:hypothetical protein n=1 Tax=Psychroserpens luteolus TaxID=2855840 RepID=UPI001E3EB968|nr:hypothetical protein [Psychroserpens luteolus]MCD2258451.1 hypothetical protein [Psychroserpens luteolus]